MPKKSALSPAEEALERVRSMCLAFPEADEKLSHGAPTFHVRGKLFVMFANHHHNDGRLAIWCKAPPGSQAALVASDPARFFVPPYVGTQGWVGVILPGVDWIALSLIVEEGWLMIAPKAPKRVPKKPRRS